MSKSTKPSKALVKTAVTSSYLFDWRTINDNIIEPEYLMDREQFKKK